MGSEGRTILAIDVGTGSVRAALVGPEGRIADIEARGHPSHRPSHGWVEQSPEDWWDGAVHTVRVLMRRHEQGTRIAAIVCCGQMHAPVLLGADGGLVEPSVPLWNDKRAEAIAASLSPGRMARQFNPPTSAWPGIKLAWLASNRPETLDRAATLLMPKDYLNFRLTGERATDWTEAGCSFVADSRAREWDLAMASSLSIPPGILPPIRRSTDIVGALSTTAAEALGLEPGVPVLVGAGDFPAALLGSGVTAPGEVSDITGTSFLLTRIGPEPVRDSLMMNVPTVDGFWGAFAVVDAAGDAVRWARHALDRDRRSYAALARTVQEIGAGADGLMFLPYLTGERLGQGSASRASFLGLTAAHGSAHLHRAVLEGVTLAMREAAEPILAGPASPRRIISAAGGARSRAWLQIKADIFNTEIVPVRSEEAGLVGCAAIALAGLGYYATPAAAARAIVRFRPPVRPIPENVAIYDRMFAAFSEIRNHMKTINSVLGKS